MILIVRKNQEWNYTFYYGSNNEEWIKEFVKNAKVVINDPCIKKKQIRIELCYVGDLEEKSEKAQVLSDLINIGGKKKVLQYFESGSDGRFVLTSIVTGNQIKNVLVNDRGKKILKVLEDFQKWKNNVLNDGFDEGFVDYYKFTHYDD